MGDIADMILEGLLDEQTGEYIGDINKSVYGQEAPGFPVSYESAPGQPQGKLVCPECGKRVKPAGIRDHLRDVHQKSAGE